MRLAVCPLAAFKPLRIPNMIQDVLPALGIVLEAFDIVRQFNEVEEDILDRSASPLLAVVGQVKSRDVASK